MIFPLGLNLLLFLDPSKDHEGAEGLDSLTPISLNEWILQLYPIVIDNIYFLCVWGTVLNMEKKPHTLIQIVLSFRAWIVILGF